MNDAIVPKIEFYTKGKFGSTLSLTLIPPTFNKTDTGKKYVEREGTFLLQFTPHKDDDKREWDKTISFALSATESHKLSFDTRNEQKFSAFHDPSKGREGVEASKKSLNIQLSKEKNAWFLNVKHNEQAISKKLTFQEMSYLQDMIAQLRPFVLGFPQILQE